MGYDSNEIIGSSLSRGQIGIVTLIPALLALPATISLIKESIPRKQVTMWAHLIHLGLVLLIIGHVMSTTIVDRGTYDHSVTMIKGEKISWENYEFEFVEVVSQSKNLEVGDGYLGAIIEVYKNGEHIGTVEPGILRFDKNNGESTSRSEVDRISMTSGDLVFIMDGTQAKTLMQGSDLVRITVYDLPGIHLVWIGWILMMIGNIATWIKVPNSFLREEE
jgi:cytochrome c biogenesis factor